DGARAAGEVLFSDHDAVGVAVAGARVRVVHRVVDVTARGQADNAPLDVVEIGDGEGGQADDRELRAVEVDVVDAELRAGAEGLVLRLKAVDDGGVREGLAVEDVGAGDRDAHGVVVGDRDAELAVLAVVGPVGARVDDVHADDGDVVRGVGRGGVVDGVVVDVGLDVDAVLVERGDRVVRVFAAQVDAGGHAAGDEVGELGVRSEAADGSAGGAGLDAEGPRVALGREGHGKV